MNLLDWIRPPVLHQKELRGLTPRQAEWVLREKHGYSRMGARKFVSMNKRRLRLAE